MKLSASFSRFFSATKYVLPRRVQPPVSVSRTPVGRHFPQHSRQLFRAGAGQFARATPSDAQSETGPRGGREVWCGGAIGLGLHLVSRLGPEADETYVLKLSSDSENLPSSARNDDQWVGCLDIDRPEDAEVACAGPQSATSSSTRFEFVEKAGRVHRRLMEKRWPIRDRERGPVRASCFFLGSELYFRSPQSSRAPERNRQTRDVMRGMREFKVSHQLQASPRVNL